ncbi:hypothetical protein TRFO_08250 [Tritrichomonas foetus]|uniref:DUF3447 domain-containing protein n=1 Tax=Tritrichomonas foetus TaxID=1144522 RepID=A0A1J4JKJ9_9EUKA|nr:hypothetical protein TRFO_08250 [Tritrichomonas foetus]|eukprot:OHS99638.1 hypothetical protein TRFO_08250 [Tritrichomonas foetus]
MGYHFHFQDKHIQDYDLFIIVNDHEVSCVKTIALEISQTLFSFYAGQEFDEKQKEQLTFTCEIPIFQDKEENYLNTLSMLLSGQDIVVVDSNYWFLKRTSEILDIKILSDFLAQCKFVEKDFDDLIQLEQDILSIPKKSIQSCVHSILNNFETFGPNVVFNLLIDICIIRPRLIHEVTELTELLCQSESFNELFQTFLLVELKKIFILYGDLAKLEIICFFATKFLHKFDIIKYQILKIISFYYRCKVNIPFFYRLCQIHLIENLEYSNSDKDYFPNEITFAIYTDNIDLLQFYSCQTSFDINKKIPEHYHSLSHVVNNECSYLEFAAFYSSVKCFKFLLINHATISEKLPKFAVAGGNPEIIHLCEQNNLSFNDTIDVAIAYNHPDLIEWLIETKNITVKPDEIFNICIRFSNFSIFDYFMKEIKLSVKNVLMVLAERGNLILGQIIKKYFYSQFLQELNGNTNDKNLITPLHIACENGNTEFVKFLLMEPTVDIYATTPSLITVFLIYLNGVFIFIHRIISNF